MLESGKGLHEKCSLIGGAHHTNLVHCQCLKGSGIPLTSDNSQNNVHKFLLHP